MERAPLRLPWTPLGFLGAHLLVKWLAPDAEGHGTDKVIEAVHRRSGRIPLLVAPVKLAATVLTIAGGGSVGKEGPAAQIGASLASGLASFLRLGRRDRRKLVICGIGAGFATVFGTPIAGAIFGLEVLVLGSLMYDVLYPSFVAGMVGYHIASRLGVRYFHQALSEVPYPTEGIFLKTIAAGALMGATAGNTLGALLGFDRGTFAAIGMVSLLAGAANAPLSASIMAIELFGPAVAPYAAMSCVVSFLIVGHRSVYPSQVLGMSKARSVRVQAGAELGSVRGVDVRPVRLRRTATILKALRKRRGNIPHRPARAWAAQGVS
jgi:H+/Cl- antiporter ClcA